MNLRRYLAGVFASLLLAPLGSAPLGAQPVPDVPWSSIRPMRPPVPPPAITDNTPSFYKRKGEWNQIIDAYWGPGAPLSEKQAIFNSYADYIQDYFTAFEGLGISWDSLRAHYYSQINDSTSHGRFSAILSYLAFALREPHTTVLDFALMSADTGGGVVLVNPAWGKPVWFGTTMPTASHFGAVLTPQWDSTALVIRAIPNHPLGLKPGDVVLGYEGVPWRQIARELLAAEVPTVVLSGGSKSMETHHLLGCAGFNWHLFDTIDIVKYPTGDTLHLPVDTLASIRMIDSMYNNESLEIPGVPWPDWDFMEEVPNTAPVTHGIVDGTNIGYIYVALHTSTAAPWRNPSPDSEERFNQAVTELWDTDGLIIDLRHERGGRTLSNFNSAFRKLLNFDTHTVDYWWRASTSDPTALIPFIPWETVGRMYIDADEETVYDRPIAVLVGPGCVSMGDITAYRLTYFPNTRFFGKPTSMGLGGANWRDNPPAAPGYMLGASDIMLRDHYSPRRDLERMEFPVDEKVWLTQDDVANGDDTVVKRALAWITGVAHAHAVAANGRWFEPGTDSVRLSARVENPHGHAVSLMAYFKEDSTVVDSAAFADDGLHGDGSAGDGLWGAAWNLPPTPSTYSATLVTTDPADTTTYAMPYMARFTTTGPVAIDTAYLSYLPDTVSWGQRYLFWFNLRNLGSLGLARNISLRLESDVDYVFPPTTATQFGDIQPNDTSAFSTPLSVVFHPTGSGIPSATLVAHIMSDGCEYWRDTLSFVVTGVAIDESGVPSSYALQQNYPNPFNPSTTIEFALPHSGFVTLKVYSVLGENVATLVAGNHTAGTFTTTWDAAGMPSGVYFYRLSVGEHVQARKMVLMR